MKAKEALPIFRDGPLVPSLKDRPLLTAEQAREMAALFKNLSNDTRLRLLHALVREGEMCVTDLGETLGMKPQAVSNQLQGLVARGILTSRRDGNNVYYRIMDPCVPILLERGLCLIECHPEQGTGAVPPGAVRGGSGPK